MTGTSVPRRHCGVDLQAIHSPQIYQIMGSPQVLRCGAERGIVGPFEGSKPRSVTLTRDQWAEMQLRMRG